MCWQKSAFLKYKYSWECVCVCEHSCVGMVCRTNTHKRAMNHLYTLGARPFIHHRRVFVCVHAGCCTPNLTREWANVIIFLPLTCSRTSRQKHQIEKRLNEGEPESKLNKQEKEKKESGGGEKDTAAGIKSTRQLQGKNIINSFETSFIVFCGFFYPWWKISFSITQHVANIRSSPKPRMWPYSSQDVIKKELPSADGLASVFLMQTLTFRL